MSTEPNQDTGSPRPFDGDPSQNTAYPPAPNQDLPEQPVEEKSEVKAKAEAAPRTPAATKPASKPAAKPAAEPTKTEDK